MEEGVVADIIKRDGVPLCPTTTAGDLVEGIETLKAKADSGGFGTLAYFLDMALCDARLQARRAAKREPASGGRLRLPG